MPTRDVEPPRAGTEAEEAANGLVMQNLPLVRGIAARLYRWRWGNSVDFNDYLQSGMLGLVEASRRFDAGRGAQFSTYASWRITGAILNSLETATEQHQQAAARKRIVEDRITSLHPLAQGDASNAPPAADIDAALSLIADVAIGLAVGFMLEGSGMFSQGEDEPAEGDASTAVGLRQLQRRLRNAVAKLPADEQAIVKNHYDEHQSFTDIAASLSLSKGRVSQLHKQALLNLRACLDGGDTLSFDA